MPALCWQTDITSISLSRQRHCPFIRLAAGEPYSGRACTEPTTPVLCYDGYLTPQNPSNAHHCIGASYHRGETDTHYREEDQQQNRQRLIDCFPDAAWAKRLTSARAKRAAAYAAPPAIICPWREMYRTMRQRLRRIRIWLNTRRRLWSHRSIRSCLCWAGWARAGCVLHRCWLKR